MEPFFLRALLAGLGLAVVSAPLGCFLVWQRMAFFGETIAHACLLGVALGLALHLDLTAAAVAVALLSGLSLVLLGRQRAVPADTLLSLLSHAALALGVLATAMAQGRSVDLMGYLFGDIFSVTYDDLVWLALGGLIVLAGMARLWRPLLAIAVHEEIAAAEGVDRGRVRLLFVLLLALVIAIALKVVGALLAVAFLIIPAAAARPLSTTPERMAAIAACVAVLGVTAGLSMSLAFDTPGGPSIVVALAVLAGLSLSRAAAARAR
jgi:zinc transport system permease protein